MCGRLLRTLPCQSFTMFGLQNKRQRPDSTSDKRYASGVGSMEFKSRAEQISHTLPATCHRCHLEVWALAKALVILY